MNRVVRMAVGLLALIPVLGLAGGLLLIVGLEGTTAAWLVLGVGLAWIGLITWWTLRAPARLSDDDRKRYLAFLRHAEFEPLDRRDDEGPRPRNP